MYNSRRADATQAAGVRPGTVAERVDPRIARTAAALERAVVELAMLRPVSRITVAELAERAGVTRATVYNRCAGPLDLLIQVLSADLERAHRREDARRAEGGHSPGLLMRLATADVVDHVERFRSVYAHALRDPSDRGVYEALVRHFSQYALAFIADCTRPDLPAADPLIMARFVAHGFVGAIETWLGDESLTTADLVDAAVACAPAWWG